MIDFGFPNDRKYSFRIGRERYQIGSHGTEVLRLLMQIHGASIVATDPYWALRVRKQIRRIEFLNARSTLVHVIEKTSDVRMRLLAIWLRGRCGGILGTSAIASFAQSSEYVTQKECVRALQRLSAWAELREIACNVKDPRIRRLATQFAAKPFGERLTCMMENVHPVPIAKRQSRFWLLPGLALGRAAPKSVETIREILMRIKRLVSS